eukprot:scaffold20621_cov156-Amphora_coffeaeformis.AAC.3
MKCEDADHCRDARGCLSFDHHRKRVRFLFLCGCLYRHRREVNRRDVPFVIQNDENLTLPQKISPPEPHFTTCYTE